MTLYMGLSLLLAAIFAGSLSGMYVAWPREMTAEEWVVHRRAVERRMIVRRQRRIWRSWPRALAGGIGAIRADLALLRLGGRIPAGLGEQLGMEMVRLAAIGAAAGLAGGLGLWMAGGPEGFPWVAPVLALCVGVLAPAIRWTRIRGRAELLRAVIRRRLPRILAGARVLMETGAASPQKAVTLAANVHDDPAAAVLREVLRDRGERGVELQDALDRIGELYGIPPLHRLASSFRVGVRYGTPMAGQVSAFALDLRRAWYATYRERINRSAVLMTVPAAIGLLLPFVALILYLAFSPLMDILSRL